MCSSQPRSIRPRLSRLPLLPHRYPACGALLVSHNFYKITPISATAELQDIDGQWGEAAMGVLSSQIVPDLLVQVTCWALLFFDVTPSRQVAATLRPHSVCAHNCSLHIAPAAAHCSDACKRVAQEPGDHRFSTPDPIGRTAYAFIFDAPIPPCCTDFSPHIPSSPYDTRLYHLCPVCSGPPTSNLLADNFVCQQSWGCQHSTAACSCLPVHGRPLRASPDRSPPLCAPYELWAIKAEWGRLAVELVGVISPRLMQSSGSGCATTCLKDHLRPSMRSWMGRQ
ncbi:hypothetical protein B0H14DRAFT_2610046 [Mycena olivaceomarginata]|nr:hypothetical protein B0H14DRAFT_2610046 [Mycena olivaceomarginata]